MKNLIHIWIKRTRKYYFPVAAILALSVYIAQQLKIFIPELLNNHLNDFLCMPIVLKVCLCVIRYVKSDENLAIPVLLQISIASLFFIYFERVLPKFDGRYTADMLDLVAYFAGLFLFMFIEGAGKMKNQRIF